MLQEHTNLQSEVAPPQHLLLCECDNMYAAYGMMPGWMI